MSLIFTAKIYAQTSWLKPVPTPPDPNSPVSPPPAPEDSRSWIKYEYKDLIAYTSQKYDLDPQLIYATIMTESQGNEHAYRFEPRLNEASYGLGQILVSTARSLGFNGAPSELFIPEIGIDLIGRYHKKYLDKYGRLSPQQLARAYNTGSPFKQARRGHLSRFNKWFYEES
ncbi:hypothetical protein A3D78_03175 [Candidatus Gottesmanbacteria bacterium RIFCSPHIGHO2_02_FULL_39_14]|uniref:Transglycosylase SLT domain-containing protein n=1 Tax=Candidatus Gottesmanbacteria bacterium RIFCSPHIGHO2_02_FULL_39_14 TaxID=1798383 RepID=A0A1F5ZXR8_9BACT|nr:MAG: hypothetical protein A3D78_03175 [Candidatus Gottesmanbacteria bacterium RIFCSPHIGHO2_02_FULL_39_14]